MADPMRHHTLTVPLEGDTCDGCGKVLRGGQEAEYRLDGVLFCSKMCAARHEGIPIDTSRRMA